jgi:hypothetical protein
MMQISCSVVGGSELAERFAACPPAYGLLLYLRKGLNQLALANSVLRDLYLAAVTFFVATSVVRPPQRSKGGDRVAGGGHERSWARRDRCGLSQQGRAQSLNCF